MIYKENKKIRKMFIVADLVSLIEQIFNGEGSLHLACNDKNALFYFLTT